MRKHKAGSNIQGRTYNKEKNCKNIEMKNCTKTTVIRIKTCSCTTTIGVLKQQRDKYAVNLLPMSRQIIDITLACFPRHPFLYFIICNNNTSSKQTVKKSFQMNNQSIAKKLKNLKLVIKTINIYAT